MPDVVGQFHEYFLKRPVAIKCRELLGMLMHSTCFDQLNVMQLVGAEACSRFVLQV